MYPFHSGLQCIFVVQRLRLAEFSICMHKNGTKNIEVHHIFHLMIVSFFTFCVFASLAFSSFPTLPLLFMHSAESAVTYFTFFISPFLARVAPVYLVKIKKWNPQKREKMRNSMCKREKCEK